MPTDRIEIQKGGGRNPAWRLRGAAKPVVESSLFTGAWGALRAADLIDDKLPVEFDVTPDGNVTNVRRYPPLPGEVRRLVATHGCLHTGLALDKYVYCYDDQSMAKASLYAAVEVNHQQASSGDGAANFEKLRTRWGATIGQLAGATAFRCTTTGPLTLHLARAGALENAGICLHPLYGFVYLPGTGLKGMARAYAEIIWLAGESDQSAGWKAIEKVFGWAPGSDRIDGRDKPWKPSGVRAHDKSDAEHAGDIVFHDSWPAKWPELVVDIVNNHHPKYYEASDNSHPPGDWENPIPVYFLAISAGNTFEFALSKRRDDVADEALDHAREWLLGALCQLGAGAKTAAGYGGFRPESKTESVPRIDPAANKVKVFETELELVTPAFLAGASQSAADCDLRPATLRGQLRWWWCMLHAGFVDVKTLRELEAIVWGDTQVGSAVRVEIETLKIVRPVAYQFKDRFQPTAEFQQAHGLEKPPKFSTQGLFYASYGMNDGAVARHFLPPGATWRVRLTAKSRVDKEGKEYSSSLLLTQAKAALALLCEFGGVGSKSRKDFGSLRDINSSTFTAQQCLSTPAELRKVLGSSSEFVVGLRQSPALHEMLNFGPIEVVTPWKAPWFALDQVGASAQAFAQSLKHKEEKAALGLPRQIHGPRREPMKHQARHQPPKPTFEVGRIPSSFIVIQTVRVFVRRAECRFR